eukprot:15895531-Heterocapsa_arctica.AAC.1
MDAARKFYDENSRLNEVLDAARRLNRGPQGAEAPKRRLRPRTLHPGGAEVLVSPAGLGLTTSASLRWTSRSAASKRPGPRHTVAGACSLPTTSRR